MEGGHIEDRLVIPSGFTPRQLIYNLSFLSSSDHCFVKNIFTLQMCEYRQLFTQLVFADIQLSFDTKDQAGVSK